MTEEQLRGILNENSLDAADMVVYTEDCINAMKQDVNEAIDEFKEEVMKAAIATLPQMPIILDITPKNIKMILSF